MPSRCLEDTIHRAIDFASERRHDFVTLEHLLLALAEDPDAIAVLSACDVDLDKLRADLCDYLDNELDYLVTETKSEPRPTEGFNRALQRAMIHVQSSGLEEVTGANVLVAIFSERESHAVYFLQEQDMTRFDAVNFISQGIAKVPDLSDTRGLESVDLPVARSPELEATFRRGLDLAISKSHQNVTLEHLLLALTEDPEALIEFHACNVDLDALRADLRNYLDRHLDFLVVGSLSVPRMARALVHVLKRAAQEAEAAGKDAMTGVDLLAAMFFQAGSFAAYFLRERNMTEADMARHASGRPSSDEAP